MPVISRFTPERKPVLLFNEHKLNDQNRYSTAILLREPRKKLTIPYIVVNRKLPRKYFNFPKLSSDFYRRVVSNISVSEAFFYKYLVLLEKAVEYYYLRYRGWCRIMYQNEVIRHVYDFLNYRYDIYSIACAIMTVIFFRESGLPDQLFVEVPNKLLKECLQDIFDVLFLPISFFYLSKVLADETKYGTIPDDPVCIARDFLSLLIWKESYPYLKYTYDLIINLGIDRNKIWITL